MSDPFSFFHPFLEETPAGETTAPEAEASTNPADTGTGVNSSTKLWEVEYMPKPLTFKEWREWNKESLKVYLERRLGQSNEDDSAQESDVEGDEEYDDSDVEIENTHQDSQATATVETSNENNKGQDEEQDELALESQEQTMNLDTQQELDSEVALTSESKENQKDPSSPPRKKQRRKHRRRIPPLTDAIHSIRTLEYMDMRTSELNLDLCRVTHIFGLRDTKRVNLWPADNLPANPSPGGHRRPASVSRECPVFPGRMPRIAFGHMEDDGPLATTYRYVVSMEIEQIFTSNANTPAATSDHKTQYPHRAHRQTRLRIFLYNSYAKAVFDWLEAHPKATPSGSAPLFSTTKAPLLMRLSHIPPICIFPYAKDPKDWFDQEHVVDYCLCIGDASNIKLTLDDESVAPLRVDAPNLQLRLAVPDSSKSAGMGSAEPMIIAEDEDSDPVFSSNELILTPQMFNDGPASNSKDYQSIEPSQKTLLETWKEHEAAHLESQRKKDETNPAAAPSETLAPSATAPGVPDGDSSANQEQRNLQLMGPQRPSPPPPFELPGEPESMAFEGSASTRENGRNKKGQFKSQAKSQPKVVEYNNLGSLREVYHNFKNSSSQEGQGRIYKSNWNSVSVNVYAVAIGFTAPTQTKRGDWMITANLVDESCTHAITIVIFTKDAQRLPKLIRTGDVIRIHRAFLQEWNGQIQLLGKTLTSYVVVRRKPQSHLSDTENNDNSQQEHQNQQERHHWVVQPTALHEYVFLDSDIMRSQSLWWWGQELFRSQPTINTERQFTVGGIAKLPQEYVTLLPSITPQQHERQLEEVRDRDLTVLVSAIIPYPQESTTSITPRGFLRVWDGTGEGPNDAWPLPALAGAIPEKDPPPKALAAVASLIHAWNQQVQEEAIDEEDESDDEAPMTSKGMEVPKALCGKVANVVIWERFHWDLILEHVPVGTFIRLRNVEIRQWKDDSFRSLMVHSKSWLSPLPELMYEVRQLLQEHDKRVRNKEFNPESGLLPVVVPPPASTIATTQHLPEGSVLLGSGLASFVSSPKQPEKYEGVVQLLQPTLPEYRGNLKVFCTESSTGFAYRCIVTISDSSAYLQAVVPNAIGEKLFGISASKAAGGLRRKEPFESDIAWNATLQAIQSRGQRFFILIDIQPVQ